MSTTLSKVLLLQCYVTLCTSVENRLSDQTLPFQLRGSINAADGFLSVNFSHSDSMVHIRVDVDNPDTENPLFMSVYTAKEIYSWTVPRMSNGQAEGSESRVFCLYGNSATLHISTNSPKSISYDIKANDMSDRSQHLNISVTYDLAPFPRLDRQIYSFSIPSDEHGVVLQLSSNDSRLCAVVAVRQWNCTDPYDNSKDSSKALVKQTMTTQSTITLFKSKYRQVDFMIEIFVPASPSECRHEVEEDSVPIFHSSIDYKTIELRIEPFRTHSYYAILWFPLIVVALAAVVLFTCVCPPIAGYMQYPAKPVYKRRGLTPRQGSEAPHSIKGSFLTSLISVAVFYALPALQLLYTNQLIYTYSGNEDVCYYNFRCLRPLGSLAAFNNVYSNIGYVIFGIFFLVIVRFHRRRFTWRYREVFYALGVALVLEGILSGGYHVCPAPQNFQFDTTFMYIIAGLCIYHLYHIRNPERPGRPHLFFCFIAAAVFYVVLALLTSNKVFLIIVTVIYTLTAILFGAILAKQLYLENAGARKHVELKGYKFKVEMFMAGIHVVLNLALVILSCYRLITEHTQFPSVLLYLMIANMFFFTLFYLVLKCLNRETVVAGSILLILIALVAWAASLYFFVVKRVTEWGLSPAESRELNHECAFLDFFDYHDIWHMLSGFSIFVSFILLLILDVSTVDLGAGGRSVTVRQSGTVTPLEVATVQATGD